MAAPHVTGAVALLYEAAGRPLSIDEVRHALALGAHPTPIALDLRTAVARVTRLAPR